MFPGYTKVIACAVAMAFSVTCNAVEKNETKVVKKIQSYSVGLGVSRVIYSPSSRGAVLSVNNPNDYPVLVQSSITPENQNVADPFLITPPLFRLDPHQQSRLRIIMTADATAKDRETLYWMCATGIPPEQGDTWAGEQKTKNTALIDVRIRASQCIKLLVRPDGLREKPQDVAKSVTWSVAGKEIKANNPTPYYMNIKTIKIDGAEVLNPEYIKPYGSTTYRIPGTSSNHVQWTLINDLGGESGPYDAKTH